MPRFDPERLLRLVSQMNGAVAQLQRLKTSPEDVFFSDADKIASAKYHLIVAIEACIDICNHVISQNGFRVPEDYADTFGVMSEAGALEKEFADRLRDMAKFRNRLVHIYWEVDERQVHEILRTRLGDFGVFAGALSNFLGRGGVGG